VIASVLDWDWATIRDALLVIGGLSAALVVAWSAVFARRAAEAAERTAAATDTPLIADVPAGEYLQQNEQVLFADGVTIGSPTRGAVMASVDAEPDGTARCSVPLRNIGRGLAAIESAQLYVVKLNTRAAARLDAAPGPQPAFEFPLTGRHPEITKRYVPVGEETRVSFAFDTSPNSSDAVAGVRYALTEPDVGLGVLVTYSDFARTRRYTAFARVFQYPGERGRYVQDVEHEPRLSPGPYMERPPWQV
jgi:hypothetical protein